MDDPQLQYSQDRHHHEVLSSSPLAAPGNTGSKAQFTCQTCVVAFYTPDLQRTHYRSDWHRYNLKRRVAGLISVTATQFAEKVLAQKSLAATTADRANFAESCKACNKTYYSENAFVNHLGSKKHREAYKKAKTASRESGAEEDVDEAGSTVDSNFSLGDSIEPSQASILESSSTPVKEIAPQTLKSEEVQIQEKLANARKLPIEECLFCTHRAFDFEANMQHMKSSHSLFIPEREYLVDLRSLIAYLQEKLSVGNSCLACNKMFRNLEAVRGHMYSKAHNRIAYDSEDEQLELSDFYDFRKSWMPESKQHASSRSIEKDEEWEDEDEDEAEDSDGSQSSWDTDAPSSNHGENQQIVKSKRNNGTHNHDDDDDDDDDDSSIASAELGPLATDYELHLPSGVTVGHRSLARYYRQNLRPRPFSTPSNGGALVHRQIADRAQLARQIEVDRSIAGVDRGRKQWSKKHIGTFADMRRREEFKTAVGFKANNQKHFRDRLLQ